jgi:hypothetical protein
MIRKRIYAQPCETSNDQGKFSKADKDEYQILCCYLFMKYQHLILILKFWEMSCAHNTHDTSSSYFNYSTMDHYNSNSVKKSLS